MSMRCARCAIDYPDDKQLCTACGDPLVVSDETATPFPRCSNCGAAASAADRFCPGCGTRHGSEPATALVSIPPRPREVALCPACGASVSVAARICDLCGAALTRAVPLPASDEVLVPFRRHRDEERSGLFGVNTLGMVSGLIVALLLVLGIKAARLQGGSTAAPVPSATPQPAILQPVGQVATADQMGIKIAGTAASDPGRSEAVIRRAVEEHFTELQQSYLAVLQADATAEGVMTLHMTLAADGTVAYVRSTSLGLADRGFVTTVERQAATWRFGTSSVGLASVHYPLVFHLSKTDAGELVTRLRESSETAARTERRAS